MAKLRQVRPMMRATALVLSAIVAGCSSSSGPTPDDLSRCEDVPTGFVRNVGEGLTVSGGGRLQHARMVRSKDYEHVYFVSAQITGEGLPSGTIGTWAANRPEVDDPGMIFAVGAVAREFSTWGTAGRTDFSRSDDGYEQSRVCVQAEEN